MTCSAFFYFDHSHHHHHHHHDLSCYNTCYRKKYLRSHCNTTRIIFINTPVIIFLGFDTCSNSASPYLNEINISPPTSCSAESVSYWATPIDNDKAVIRANEWVSPCCHTSFDINHIRRFWDSHFEEGGQLHLCPACQDPDQVSQYPVG